MNYHGMKAIYRFEMARTGRTLMQSIVAPVISTSLYFVVFGAVYAPGSKPGEGVGVAALEAAVRATQLPVVAIGGIQPEQIGECIRAGASGIAVVSGILGAQDVHAAIERYVHAIAVAEGTPA